MAGSVPDAMERAALDHINGVATLTITTPVELRLMTANGDDDTNGTEVTGGSYAAQAVTLGSASTSSGTTSATNTGDVDFEGMPAVGGSGVVGWEIWDATPQRIWHGDFDAPKAVASGETARVAAGELALFAD